MVGIKITVFTLQWVTKFQLTSVFWKSIPPPWGSIRPSWQVQSRCVSHEKVSDGLLVSKTRSAHTHEHTHVHTTIIIIVHTHTHTHLQSMSNTSNRVKDWGFHYFDIICLKLLGLLNFAFESWSVCTQCFYFKKRKKFHGVWWYITPLLNFGPVLFSFI